MKRKIKILLPHEMEDNVSVPSNPQAFWKKCLFLLPNLLAAISYNVGYLIVTIFQLPKNIVHTIRNKSWSSENSKALVGFLLLLVIAAAPFGLLKLASEGETLTGRVLGMKDDLISNADSAQTAVKNKDYQLAQTNFTNILGNLQNAQTQLDNSSLLLRSIIKLTPDKYSSENVLQAATLLTESGIIGSQVMQQVENLSITPEGLGANAAADFNKLTESTNQLTEKINKANELLKVLDPSLLPAEIQLALRDSQDFVAQLSTQLAQFNRVMDLAKQLLMNDQRFLIVLQNNNELRATGGFMGTVAQGSFSNGSIKKLDIRSVYDLDGQLIEQIKVPSPMLAVNNRLFLRDSNWLANFPESAQLITSLYEKEGGETPDLVIAITPEVFIELLKLTGPITLPTYKITLSAENFIETVQTTTSIEYDKTLNQPKQMLADLYPALMQQLNQLFKGNPLLILGALQKSLNQKDIILYSRNPELQQNIESFHWAGKTEDTDKDYLQIVSTNLSGTKTDRYLNREVSIHTSINEDGQIINQLKYTIQNPLPTNTNLTNKSWVRFFVPSSSKLIAQEGFINTQLPDEQTEQNTNSFITAWQDSVKFDEARNAYIGQEAGKTYFANWVEVAPGQTTTVTLTYQLPFKLRSNISHYSLLLQKQPGMMPFNFIHSIELANHAMLWQNLDSKQIAVKLENDTASYNHLIDQDQFYGLVLDKQ